MPITINVARTTPDAAFRRLVEFTTHLGQFDSNFRGLELQVQRRDGIDGFEVADTDDEMRKRLLLLLVSDVLSGEAGSVWGDLH
ncbi:MAG TPA: hypothetical protein VMA55_09970 [Acidovorax sp.]|nr:hypothetical protein [Acidovorax sp.]